MPAAPSDGMMVTLSSTQQITALTLQGNTGQTVSSAVTLLPAKGAASYVYRLSNTTWYPSQSVFTAGSQLVSGTSQATTSGTSIDFTGIPSWVKRITVMFNGVSVSGSSNFIIQLGDSGGIEITGYSGGSFNAGVASYNTAGFDLTAQQLSTQLWGGSVTLTNITGNTWCESGVISGDSSGYIGASGGSKTLSATLDRIRVTTANGTDTFDAGSINILYE
jgi:hypothetical protein